jgi:DamX protein
MLDTPRGDLTHSMSARFSGVEGPVTEKERKKDKKGQKRAETARSLAALGAELARLDLALRRLDDRVGHLHSAQWAQQEAGTLTASKIAGFAEALQHASADAAAATDREQELRAHLGQLQTAVEALRAEAGVITESLADIAAQPDRDTALFVLEDRIAAGEELIGSIQARLDEAQPDQEIGAELARALSDLESLRLQVAEGLRGQDERVSSLEQQIGGQIEALKVTIPSEERWSEAYRGLREDLGSRLQSLSGELETAQRRGDAALAREHAWTEQRLSGVSRKFGLAIGTLGLMLLALSAANWWHTDAKLASLSPGKSEGAKTNASTAAPQGPLAPTNAPGPDSALVRLTATLQAAQAENSRLADHLLALQKPDRVVAAADMPARVKRLEQTQSDLKRSAEESAKLAASLNARLDAVARNLPALPGQTTATASPESLSAGSKASSPHTPVPPVAEQGSAPGTEGSGKDNSTVLADPRYVIQLIGFRMQSSLQPFAQRFGIADSARYMRSSYQGNDWYVVLIGSYATQAEGLAAARQLPEKLQTLKPWVRQLPAGSQLFPVK